MISILRAYAGIAFHDLPAGVQTTLKAMHVLTKYYSNILDAFGLVLDEEKSIHKIQYGSPPLMLSDIESDLQCLWHGLSQTAINNLHAHTPPALTQETQLARSHPTLGMPQSLTTLGLMVILDYMKKHQVPLLLKVTRVLGTGIEGKGKKQKGVFQGQGQDVLLLVTDPDGHLKLVPKEQWADYATTPAFAIRIYAVKSLLKTETFLGYAQDLHAAESFQDFLAVLTQPGFVPFLLNLNACVDGKAKGRLPVCEALQPYFDPTAVSYPIYWNGWGAGEGSIPMESPHVYVSTLDQQLKSLKPVSQITVHKKLIKQKGSKQ